MKALGWHRLCWGLPLLLALPAVRELLESRMSLHMAVELPLLLACGWILAAAGSRWQAWLARVDDGGLLTATTVSSVLALWMVPTALDLALLMPGFAALKYGMWAAAGALLRAARGRFTPVIQAFFLGNAAWMTVTAGLLYLEAERQLCVNYRLDDQPLTGWALVGWGLVLGAGALRVLRPLLSPDPRAP